MKGIKKQIDEALEELATALEQGHSEALRKYLTMMARFTRYSLGNQLLIAIQRPEATRVAGFRTWQKLGRQVRRGERGISILAPCPYRRTLHPSGNSDAATEEIDGVYFRVVHVFDIAQTDGEPLPECASVTGNPAEQLDQLQDYVKTQGITLTFADNLNGALGLSAGGKISILNGMTPAETYAAIAHELGHELLHRKHDAAIPHRVRELEAEAIAHVVCQAAGLLPGTASSDYIQLHQGNRDLLMASLERIRQTAATIINGLEEQQHEPVKGRQSQPRDMPVAESSATTTGDQRSQAA